MNQIYNNPIEWLKQPLIKRLEELRKINCTGPCGQSHSTFCKRICEDTTIKETIEILKTLVEQK